MYNCSWMRRFLVTWTELRSELVLNRHRSRARCAQGALLTALQAHRWKQVELCGYRWGVLHGGRGRGGGHHAMPSTSMPSYPPISIYPNLPAHHPRPMGWLCLPVCLQTNQSDHRMRTQQRRRPRRRTMQELLGKILCLYHSSHMWCQLLLYLLWVHFPDLTLVGTRNWNKFIFFCNACSLNSLTSISQWK